jgi:hypothetical protein
LSCEKTFLARVIADWNAVSAEIKKVPGKFKQALLSWQEGRRA